MRYQCSCCQYYTLQEESDDICPVCAWQEDIVQREDPDFTGGPNLGISLNQARKNYALYGVSNLKFLEKVREPFPEECSPND